MRYQISRRAVLGGSIAIAGAGACIGLAVAEDFKLAADEELFVGFSTARPLLQGRHLINWRWLVSNDGRDKFPVWCPPSRFAGAQQLEHGARVWAARRRTASDRRLNQSVRILRVASVDSIEASSARDESERSAWENGQWLKSRVLVPVRNRGDSVLIRCQVRHDDDRPFLHKTRPVGALATATRSDRLLVKLGQTWEGWKVFEARLANGEVA